MLAVSGCHGNIPNNMRDRVTRTGAYIQRIVEPLATYFFEFNFPFRAWLKSHSYKNRLNQENKSEMSNSYDCRQTAVLSWDFSRIKSTCLLTKNIFIPPLAITKFKVIPINFLEKKSARAGFGPDRQGHGCKERLIRLWDYRFWVVIQFLLTLFIFVFCDFEMFNKASDKYALHQSFTDLVLTKRKYL